MALDILSERAAEGLRVHPVLADLEAGRISNRTQFVGPDRRLLVICSGSLSFAFERGVRRGGLFIGVFPMSGINPAYLMRAGRRQGSCSGIGGYCTTRKPSGRKSSPRSLEWQPNSGRGHRPLFTNRTSLRLCGQPQTCLPKSRLERLRAGQSVRDTESTKRSPCPPGSRTRPS